MHANSQLFSTLRRVWNALSKTKSSTESTISLEETTRPVTLSIRELRLANFENSPLLTLPAELHHIIADELSWNDLRAYRHVCFDLHAILEPVVLTRIKKTPLNLTADQVDVLQRCASLFDRRPCPDIGELEDSTCSNELFSKLLRSIGVGNLVVAGEPMVFGKEERRKRFIEQRQRAEHKEKLSEFYRNNPEYYWDSFSWYFDGEIEFSYAAAEHALQCQYDLEIKQAKVVLPNAAENELRDELRARNVLEILPKLMGKNAVLDIPASCTPEVVDRAVQYIKDLHSGSGYAGFNTTGSMHWIQFFLHGFMMKWHKSSKTHPARKLLLYFIAEWLCEVFGQFDEARRSAERFLEWEMRFLRELNSVGSLWGKMENLRESFEW
ncbi:hypothetical protein BJ508DRAFT_361300 [Ascobolus immersus RN42]|uniref:F-box domain-containing protein n=1 Tax=Ascobolus immersus RN42 TaxID=1160509 RepID=A0A3N4IL74_ASCIM|nr:hypothetical protein BJ508DRAFT_361300 [Ascobolus immersus RN42]